MSVSANTTTSPNVQLPEIKDGEKCVPNKLYRMECNTCKCGLANTLLCTKKACLDKEAVNRVMTQHQKAKESANENARRSRASVYPRLPSGKCVPGKIYQKSCYLCFCNDEHIVICSSQNKCLNAVSEKRLYAVEPSDVRSEFTSNEIISLPRLLNGASRCESGKSYKVDCNVCLCKADRNLLCGKTLCLSQEDMNRIDAEKKSGLPCKKDADIEKKPCLKCTCARGLSKCEAVHGCEPTGERRLHGPQMKYKPRLTLDLKNDEKCFPSTIYKDNCNKCYCQQDGSLRCTQKTCLNYVQSLKLKKHRLFLEKHGL